jgi:hypothetical protein
MAKNIRSISNKYFDDNEALYARLGTTDAVRALSATNALFRKLAHQERYNAELLEITGSDNIGNAMKVIRAQNSGRRVPVLPIELTKIPEIWLKGRMKRGNDPGFAQMSLKTCQREYRFIQPLLEESWELIEQQPEEFRDNLREQLLTKYQRYSPTEMSRECYAFVNDYDLDEVIEEADLKVKTKHDDPLLSELSKAIEATIISPKDYGVQSKNDSGK